MARGYGLFLIFSLLFCVSAFGEDKGVWPAWAKGEYGTIDVVTVKQPSARHRCHSAKVTANAILCGGFLRNKAAYQRDDVAALILPPYHGDRNAFIVEVSIIAGCIVGSFFAPGTALPIFLRVAAGLPIAYVFFFTDWLDDGPDHDDDYILYQKSGTTLSVKLRGQKLATAY